MKYKCVIFDMDGTLVESLPGLVDAANATFKEMEIDHSITYEEGKSYIGAGAIVFVKRVLSGVNLSQEEAKKFQEIYLKYYKIYQKTSAKPYPNLKKLLLDLKANGCHLCIASNKPDELLKLAVEQLFPEIKFDIIFGQQPGIPDKPNPTMIFKIMESLKLNPSDCVYVGDSKYDLETAENAKIDSLIVTYGYGYYDEPWINKATYVASTADQIEQLFID